ncbi:ribosome-inactivating family protein [Streptomyces sp. NPDC048550]|uniref:ribosome-inactivating family protein n=1 Tax=Streptomyces sp. NPDC048550 TaxID=3155739 RepID=UPI00343EFDF2
MRKTLPAALLGLALLGAAAPASQASTEAPPALPAAQPATIQQAQLDWNLSGNQREAAAEYTRFIRSLHERAGTILRGHGDNTVWQTNAGNDIIEVIVALPEGRRLSLYLTTQNLYLRGFATAGGGGPVFQFTDPTYDLGHQLGRNAVNLGYSGSYGNSNGNQGLQVGDAANRTLAISLAGLQGQFQTLWRHAADGNQNQNAVRNTLVHAIAAIGEGTRFRNIEGTVRAGIASGATITAQEASEENQWGPGSTYMLNETARPGAGGSFNLGGTNLRGFGDMSRYISMVKRPG